MPLQIHQNLNTSLQHLKKIHWLPIEQRIDYKLLLTYKNFKFSNLIIFTIVSLFLLTLCLQNHLIHRFCPERRCLTVGRRSRDLRPLSCDRSVTFSKIFPIAWNVKKTLFDSWPTAARTPTPVAPIEGGWGAVAPQDSPKEFLLLDSLIQCSIYVHEYQAYSTF